MFTGGMATHCDGRPTRPRPPTLLKTPSGCLPEQSLELGEKPISIALKSGEYGGRNRSRLPTVSIASRSPLILWADRLSMTTISPGRRLWRENLLGVGQEGRTVHRAVDRDRRRHAIQAQPSGEGGRLPRPCGTAARHRWPQGPRRQAILVNVAVLSMKIDLSGSRSS